MYLTTSGLPTECGGYADAHSIATLKGDPLMNFWFRRHAAVLLALMGIGIALFASVQASALSRKPAAPTAVAVVDWTAVADKIDLWKDMLAELKALDGDLQRQGSEMQKALTELNESIQVLPEGGPARQRAREEFNLQLLNFNAWKAFAENKLKSEQAKRRIRLYNSITTAVGRIAERDGWQIVLLDDSRSRPIEDTRPEEAANIMNRRQVLYSHAQAVDITDEVVLLMNNEFRAGK
ncbi:MAG: OmpH family outer membrane protein [Phycisphaerales bacterium]|nr:OmpH family outer membrane protein [Phycisphaerales bacterium]